MDIVTLDGILIENPRFLHLTGWLFLRRRDHGHSSEKVVNIVFRRLLLHGAHCTHHWRNAAHSQDSTISIVHACIRHHTIIKSYCRDNGITFLDLLVLADSSMST